jgi:hypothetical protein
VTDAMQDPWSGLDDPKALPAEADAAARAAGLAPDDPRRAAGLTSWLVHRATLNGSTCLPAEVLARALAGFGVDDPVPGVRLADDQGRIVALPEERLAAPAQVAAQEETVADELARLLENTTPERPRTLWIQPSARVRASWWQLQGRTRAAGSNVSTVTPPGPVCASDGPWPSGQQPAPASSPTLRSR